MRKPVWKDPCFCISVREALAPPEYHYTWMRRKPCCDCGETVIYDPAPLGWELLRPYLIICNVCATARNLETGGMALDVHRRAAAARPVGVRRAA